MSDCKSIIPDACGKWYMKMPDVPCGQIRFTGLTDITVKQGNEIGLASGVHAYDGEGNEIEFTYSPEVFDACEVGSFQVTYKALGTGSKMLPHIACLEDSMLAIAECESAYGTATRTVTITSMGEPTIYGAVDRWLPWYKKNNFDFFDGVYAEDGNGKQIPVTCNGTLPLEPRNNYVTYTAVDECGNKAEVTIILDLEETAPTCFIKGTKVWTENGLANIEDIAVGDKVLSYNDLTEETELGTVTNVTKSDAESVYAISIGDETISVTGEHRMYLPTEDRYEAVENLKAGDELLNVDRSHAVIDSIEEVSGEYTVHNLEVDTFSNYFVGEGGYLSYNMNISGVIRLSPKSFRSANTTHYFQLTCEQRTTSHSIGTFDYEIKPKRGGTPPLNNSTGGIYTFSLTGVTSGLLDLSVDISEDGVYEYSVTPKLTPAPCSSAEERYTVTLYIGDGALQLVTIRQAEGSKLKVDKMQFTPSCEDPYQGSLNS